MLKLVEFCFEDENGEKIYVKVPDGFHVPFKEQTTDSIASANLIAGFILAKAINGQISDAE
ncbi:MAG: hypothetical protein E7310_05440 [Clostridiales bacterium]|nr:hypothetical protein [Clostridiales bacterium]